MNKRDILFNLLEQKQPLPYVPAAFFLHFPPDFHTGQAAINKHLEYFHYTDMDLVKIQYEKPFPKIPAIQKPEDWAKMPHYGRDFFAEQLEVVKGLVHAAKRDAVVVVTLYSPYMSAGHTTSDAMLTEHLKEAPEQVKQGMEIITDSLLGFVRECIKLGVDGFYHSTQGGEANRFDRATFEAYVKPFDLVLMDEAKQHCAFNILHVCDYLRPYDDFAPFIEYPGHIVNCPLEVGDQRITPGEAARLFGRPYMGGLERKGILETGTAEQIRAEVEAILREAPDYFMLAADCTVPSETSWDKLQTAITIAHQYTKDAV